MFILTYLPSKLKVDTLNYQIKFLFSFHVPAAVIFTFLPDELFRVGSSLLNRS